MLSLVIPVYRNESGIDALLDAVESLHEEIGSNFEAVFVVDGSPDASYMLLRDKLPGRTFTSQLLALSRNFGSFAAIRAGLHAARGDIFAIMAADLQEPPKLILEMHRVLSNGEADIAIGTRSSREDLLIDRLSSGLFWWLYRRYVIPDMPVGGVDIFACTRSFRDELLALQEHHTSLVGQVFWLGYRRVLIPYRRVARKHGKSSWTLRRKLDYMLDSIFAFTDLPIRLLIGVGGSAALLSGMLALSVVVLRILGRIPVPGYAMTMLMLIFFGALNLFALGVVGSYAWRTYENSKGRPHHLVLRQHRWDSKET